MQYSLRTLLIAVFFASILCAAFFALPGWLGLTVLLTLFTLLPATFVLGIIYSQGYQWAFFVGCAAGLLNVTLLQWVYLSTMVLETIADRLGFGSTSSFTDDVILGKVLFGFAFSTVLVSGLLGVWAHWLSLRSRRPEAAPPANRV